MKRLPEHLRLGSLGEKLAARELIRLGLAILDRNFSEAGVGEIDLICRDGDVLVFIEVKTRTAGQVGRPADAITSDKRRKIKLTADRWRSKKRLRQVAWRFDVVEVLIPAGWLARWRAQVYIHPAAKIQS